MQHLGNIYERLVNSYDHHLQDLSLAQGFRPCPKDYMTFPSAPTPTNGAFSIQWLSATVVFFFFLSLLSLLSHQQFFTVLQPAK